MAAREWYRRTTWTKADQQDFFTRLSRAKRENRAQYLRIQAFHLQEERDGYLLKSSLQLIDYLLEYYPVPFELASAHNQRAACLDGLGEIEEAVRAYRASFAAEAALPNIMTTSYLDFPLFCIRHRLEHLYREALAVLDGRIRQETRFPVLVYREHLVRAFFAEHGGELEAARAHARIALNAADQKTSGLRYHPNLGLVETEDAHLFLWLQRLALKE